MFPTRSRSSRRFCAIPGQWLALLVPVLLSGCFFKLPETPSVDIPQLQDEDLVPLEDFNAADAAYDQSGNEPEMIWRPDDTGTGIDWAGQDVDVVDEDGLLTPDTSINFDENCPYPLTTFTDTVRTQSFIQVQQSLLSPVDPTLPPEQVPPPDKLYVYYLTCGLKQSSYCAERGYAVSITEPSVLNAQAECSHSCYFYVYKDGCNYNNLVDCWSQGSTSAKMSLDVLPGLYLVVVEFIGDELWDMTGTPDYSQAWFDLHVAVNHVAGQEQCVTETAQTPLPEVAVCTEGGEATWELAAPGVLAPEVGDDFDLGCGMGDVKADPIGGMADQAHSLTIPADWTEPVRVIAEVTFLAQEPPLSHLFAVTSAPCGAPQSVIDCVWGTQQTLTVPEILALPGDTLFAVVDGLGKDAFTALGGQPYTVTWRISGACPE